jgi:hypothetical protein
MPVTIIAIRSEARVRTGSYVVGRADLKASMAMKCVAQMPEPAATAVCSAQAQRLKPRELDDMA